MHILVSHPRPTKSEFLQVGSSNLFKYIPKVILMQAKFEHFPTLSKNTAKISLTQTKKE